MKIAITGTSSGLGQALMHALKPHSVIPLTRSDLDLSDIGAVNAFALPPCDILINCAGTGLGGKRPFLDHSASAVQTILNVNLIAPIMLSQKALRNNADCKIVNITSTNNRRYWPNDLAYSLSKSALSEFGNMLRVDYPDCQLLEVRLGLTKTQFNHNRYQDDPDRYQDIYQQPHLMPVLAAQRIVNVLFDETVKFLEIAP